MTQADLADCVACSLGMIRKIEQDERRPSRQMTLRLAECLQIPFDEQITVVKVARRERSVEKLTSVSAAPVPALGPTAEPIGGQIRPLPAQATPFIGRSEELAEIARLLAHPECRLLTLLGLGGMGKTRLALAAAGAQPEKFPHGVAFVSLAELPSSELAVRATAESLGLAFHGEQDPEGHLLSYLRPRQMLLILDGIEHPPSVAHLVSKILQTARGVKVLVTSQQRLNLREEWLFEVHGMSVEKSKISGLVEDSDAVALFVQSARRVRPDFSLSADNWTSVIQICELMDGMPLGIELASAWVRTLSCHEIAIELGKGLELLAPSQIDASAVQAGIRAIFDRPLSLLSGPQQEVLSRLSVFRGPFQRDAAVQIAGASLDILADLVDKSLLHIDASGRYVMDELPRRLASERLGESPTEMERVQSLYSRYFGQVLREKEQELKGLAQAQALQEIADAIVDIRLGWQWAVEHAEWAVLESYLDSLFTFYETRGLWAEGTDELAAFVDSMAASETGEQEQIGLRGRALSRLGRLAAHLGRYDLASQALKQSLIALSNLDPAEVAFACSCLGYLASLQGRYEEANQRVEDSLAIYTAIDDKWGIGSCLTLQGDIARECGEDDRARQLGQDSLTIHKDIGNPRGIALALNGMAGHALGIGDYQEAKRLLQQSQQLFTGLGDRSGQAIALKSLAGVARGQELPREARRLLSESLAIFRAIGNQQGMVHCLDDLGNLACRSGQYNEAVACFREGLRLAMGLGAIHLALDILTDLAAALFAQGKGDETLRAIGLVLARPECQQGTRQKAQRLLSELEAELSERTITDKLAQGEALGLEVIMSSLLSSSQ